MIGIEDMKAGMHAVAVSISGGKDSAATALHLRELGIPARYVFADTGWEHPETYDYLRGELTRMLGPIEEVRAKVGGMVDLVRARTGRGGRQIKLLDTSDPDDGCARWGMCESSSKEDGR